MLAMMLLLLIISSVIIFLYVNFITPALYWRKRGIFYVPPWRRYATVFFSKKSVFETVVDGYSEFPARR